MAKGRSEIGSFKIIKSKLITLISYLLTVGIVLVVYYIMWGYTFSQSYIETGYMSFFVFFMSLLIDLFVINRNKIVSEFTLKRISIYVGIVFLFYLIGGNIATVMVFLLPFKRDFVAHILLCYLVGLLLNRSFLVLLKMKEKN